MALWTINDKVSRARSWVTSVSEPTTPLYAVFYASDGPWPGEDQDEPPFPPDPPNGILTQVGNLTGISHYFRIDPNGENSSIRYVVPNDSQPHITYQGQGYRYVSESEIYDTSAYSVLVSVRIPGGAVNYSGFVRGWGFVEKLKLPSGDYATAEKYLVSEVDETSGYLTFVENTPSKERDPVDAEEYRLLRNF